MAEVESVLRDRPVERSIKITDGRDEGEAWRAVATLEDGKVRMAYIERSEPYWSERDKNSIYFERRKDVLEDITLLIDVLTTFKDTIVGSANDGEAPDANS